jgi:hypothetical protein
MRQAARRLAARSPTTRTILSYFRIIETGAVARLLSSNSQRSRPGVSSSKSDNF